MLCVVFISFLNPFHRQFHFLIPLVNQLLNFLLAIFPLHKSVVSGPIPLQLAVAPITLGVYTIGVKQNCIRPSWYKMTCLKFLSWILSPARYTTAKIGGTSSFQTITQADILAEFRPEFLFPLGYCPLFLFLLGHSPSKIKGASPQDETFWVAPRRDSSKQRGRWPAER